MLRTIGRNPQILEQITAPLGSAAQSVGKTGGAVGELGSGAGEALHDVGTSAGKAAGDAGATAAEAGSGLGEDAEDSAEGTAGAADVGDDAGNTTEGSAEAAPNTAASRSDTQRRAEPRSPRQGRRRTESVDDHTNHGTAAHRRPMRKGKKAQHGRGGAAFTARNVALRRS